MIEKEKQTKIDKFEHLDITFGPEIKLPNESFEEAFSFAINKIFNQTDPNIIIKCLSTILCSISINPELKSFVTNLQFFEFCRIHFSSDNPIPSITSFIIQILTHLFTIQLFVENEQIWNVLITLIISKIPMKASIKFFNNILGIDINFSRLLIERLNLINLLIKSLSFFSQFQFFQKSTIKLLQRYQHLYRLNKQQCEEMIQLFYISLQPKERLHRDAQKPFAMFFLTYPDPILMDMFLQSEAFFFIWHNFNKPCFSIARKLILRYLDKILTSSPERALFLLKSDVRGFIITGMNSIPNLPEYFMQLILNISKLSQEICFDFFNKELNEIIENVFAESTFKVKSLICEYLILLVLNCPTNLLVLNSIEKYSESFLLTVDVIFDEKSNLQLIKNCLMLFNSVASLFQKDEQQQMHPIYSKLYEYICGIDFREHLSELISYEQPEIQQLACYLLEIDSD